MELLAITFCMAASLKSHRIIGLKNHSIAWICIYRAYFLQKIHEWTAPSNTLKEYLPALHVVPAKNKRFNGVAERDR